MFTRLPCLALVSALFCSSVSAVTLNDFTPRVDNLSGDCQKLYTSTISNCKPSDFAKGQCSAACVSSLHDIGDSVRKSCSGQGGSGNIVAAFLNGQGAGQLCPNAVAASSAPSKSPTIGSSTMVLSSTSAPSSGLILDTSSTPASSSKSPSKSPSSGTLTAISTATLEPKPQAMSATSSVGSTLAFDTSTPSDVATSTTKSHAAKHTNSESGGGSPFDTAEGAASGVAMSAAMLVSAVGACLLMLQ